jgi:hypothetical protein
MNVILSCHLVFNIFYLLTILAEHVEERKIMDSFSWILAPCFRTQDKFNVLMGQPAKFVTCQII